MVLKQIKKMIVYLRNMKTAAIFLNGDAPNNFAVNHAFDHRPEFILCTDGAYAYMKDIGLLPDAIIGDMDSITETPSAIKYYQIDNQDTTDFEKALQFLSENGFEKVLVLGGTGGQHDHFLGNLNAAYKYRNELNIKFFDQDQHFWLTEKSAEFRTQPGKVVSLIPFPSAHVLSLEGLQYGLNDEALHILDRVGTRNVAISHLVNVQVKDGALWIFVSY